jgi:citrate synthase
MPPSLDPEPTLINVDSINVDESTSRTQDVGMTTMIGAVEAARLLGVTKPTLYAYVSRGLLDRHASVDGRRSLYPRDQVEQLATRGRTKAPTERPSIDVHIASAITRLGDDTLRYRGHDVRDLVGNAPFESVASLLWTGELPERPPTWPIDRAALDRCAAVVRAAATADPVAALGLCAQTLSSTGNTETGAGAAATLLSIAPTVLGGPRRGTVADRLAQAYVRRPAPELVRAVDAALVLMADHELATSTLSVRVACSVRADPYAALASGLAVVSGPLHGGAAAMAATLFERAAADGVERTVASYLDQGRLPGFGHSVYRNGDPRVVPLLAAVRAIPGSEPAMATVDALIAEVGRRITHLPNVDVALGALLRVTGLPADAPLFGVARLAGWGAHYDEELDERPVRFRGLTKLR